MPLPSSGPLSLSQVNVELKRAATATISLGETVVRDLAKKPSGAISFADLHGKSAEVFTQYTMTAGYIGQRDVGDGKFAASIMPPQVGYSVELATGPWTNGSIGSIYPTTFRGVRLRDVLEWHGTRTAYNTGSGVQDITVHYFTVMLDDFGVDPGASFIKKVEVLSGSTVLLSLDTSAAFYTYSTLFTNAEWRWDIAAAWTMSDGGVYTVKLHYE